MRKSVKKNVLNNKEHSCEQTRVAEGQNLGTKSVFDIFETSRVLFRENKTKFRRLPLSFFIAFFV